MLLQATRFPTALTHGFTTRRGGVSVGPYESLNMGAKWGDDPHAVAENLRRVAKAGGFSPEDFVRVRQVHGDAVVAANAVDADTEADGIWHHRDHGTSTVVAVLTADCVPILFADEEGTVAAAVHSGWRGTVKEIAVRTVETLVKAGADRATLRAAIGPCIEVEAFEVGDEVAEQFDESFVRRVPGANPHVDLVAAVQAQLRGAGLSADNIERIGGCTHADATNYFSYRRDAYGRDVKTGQHLSFVGWR